MQVCIYIYLYVIYVVDEMAEPYYYYNYSSRYSLPLWPLYFALSRSRSLCSLPQLCVQFALSIYSLSLRIATTLFLAFSLSHCCC